MPLIKRLDKGSPLTAEEYDGNLDYFFTEFQNSVKKTDLDFLLQRIISLESLVSEDEIVAPTIRDPLENITLTSNTGNINISTASSFNTGNDVLTYSLVNDINGVSIDQNTGSISVNTDVASITSGVDVIVRATNSVGYVDSSFVLILGEIPTEEVVPTILYNETSFTGSFDSVEGEFQLKVNEPSKFARTEPYTVDVDNTTLNSSLFSSGSVFLTNPIITQNFDTENNPIRSIKIDPSFSIYDAELDEPTMVFDVYVNDNLILQDVPYSDINSVTYENIHDGNNLYVIQRDINGSRQAKSETIALEAPVVIPSALAVTALPVMSTTFRDPPNTKVTIDLPDTERSGVIIFVSIGFNAPQSTVINVSLDEDENAITQAATSGRRSSHVLYTQITGNQITLDIPKFDDDRGFIVRPYIIERGSVSSIKFDSSSSEVTLRKFFSVKSGDYLLGYSGDINRTENLWGGLTSLPTESTANYGWATMGYKSIEEDNINYEVSYGPGRAPSFVIAHITGES